VALNDQLWGGGGGLLGRCNGASVHRASLFFLSFYFPPAAMSYSYRYQLNAPRATLSTMPNKPQLARSSQLLSQGQGPMPRARPRRKRPLPLLHNNTQHATWHCSPMPHCSISHIAYHIFACLQQLRNVDLMAYEL
jgi:hypothetical protein